MITPTKIKELYNKYDVSASKRFGQNFLIDKSALDLIMEVSQCQNKEVIEIGPGLGSLTIFLLENAKNIIAYEIDKDMINVLKNEFSQDNLKIKEQDFLKAEFPWVNKKTIVANIPYYITSDILFKIFRNSEKFQRVTLMIQKEVAQRLVAPIGSKEYSKLTVTANLFASDIKLERIVKPTSFLPAPKVDSAIVTFNLLEEKPNNDLIVFVKKCFAFRRKTLFNNLKEFNDPIKSKEAIEHLNLKNTVRPQELSTKEFKNLYIFLKG